MRLVVVVAVLIGAIGLSAYPVSNSETALEEPWLEAPLVGVAASFDGSLPELVVDALEVAVGSRRYLILRRCRDDVVLGHHTPHVLAGRARVGFLASSRAPGAPIRRVERGDRDRSGARDQADRADGVAAGGDRLAREPYWFGVLIAFTAAQLAVVRLRMREPDLERPYRAWPNVSIGAPGSGGGALGAPLTAAIFVLAMITHPGARYAGPAWLVAGSRCSSLCAGRGGGSLRAGSPVGALPSSADFERILVPMKLGDIGEEMVATAIALAKERGSAIEAITVVRVPRSTPSKASSRPRSLAGSTRRSRKPEPSAPTTG